VTRLLAVAAALALASPALAQFDEKVGPSPRWGSVDVGVQWYRPNIDASVSHKPGPYEKTFGSGNGWMLVLGVAKSLYTKMGTLDVGLKTGYFSESAKGFVLDNAVPPGSPPEMLYTQRAGGDTSFRIIPTSAVLTYRFDWLVEHKNIPVAPYARVALERYNWWITTGAGHTAEKGATHGWTAAAGLAFLVDFLDPQLAREFDLESGVNHTYFFFEIVTGKIDDFGSSKSWDLGPEGLSLAGGLTFVF
jgi:hypothetical protein